MWRNPAFFICVFALICSLVDKFLFRRNRGKQVSFSEPVVFVCIASYCDGQWGDMVRKFLEKSTHPQKIRIGVIEYIEKAEDSLEPHILAEWRHQVHVYAVSRRVATTQRNAQRLCMSHLYKNEPYVLFTRACDPIRGWDAHLLESACQEAVITAHMDETGVASFPCLRRGGRYRQRAFAVENASLVPSLLYDASFAFVSADAVNLALSCTNPLTITSKLLAAGKKVLVPALSLGKRVPHPVGVATGKYKSWVDDDNIEYAKVCGFVNDTDAPNILSRLGLSAMPESNEMITKYGSVLAARLAIQTAESKKVK